MSERGCRRVQSSLQDERIARIVSALCKDGETGADVLEAAPPEYDWAALYGGEEIAPTQRRTRPIPTFVGPAELRCIPGRGLGLVAARDVQAGELILVENAWALVASGGDGAAEGLLDVCFARLKDPSTHPLERLAILTLNSADDEDGGGESRKQCLQAYLDYLRKGSCSAADTQTCGGHHGAPANRQHLRTILRRNARRTEWWDPLTLLLDDTRSQGGLWIACSLFNHSCLGNVIVTYCHGSKERGLGTLVARAATNVPAGEELCHTYVYPFETVKERRQRLLSNYGFVCTCTRCVVEEPLEAESTNLADSLDTCVNAFSLARKDGNRRAMSSTIRDFKTALAQVESSAVALFRSAASAKHGEVELRTLWKSQFVWGFHGLAMSAQQINQLEEAVAAFRKCVQLIAVVAPSSGYELKYRMMLLRTLAQKALLPGGVTSGEELKVALKEAEETHHRCYGGGSRHFLVRMKGRLEEVFAALRVSSKR